MLNPTLLLRLYCGNTLSQMKLELHYMRHSCRIKQLTAPSPNSLLSFLTQIFTWLSSDFKRSHKQLMLLEVHSRTKNMQVQVILYDLFSHVLRTFQ